MIKKMLLATVAGSVVQFLLGWLIYGIFLSGFMDSQTTHFEGLMKDMNSGSFVLVIFLSGLVMSFLFAFIFQRWAKFETFFSGLKAGLFMGFFMSLSFDLASYSMMNLMSEAALVVDVITGMIVTGIVCSVIGWVLGMGKKAVPPAGS